MRRSPFVVALLACPLMLGASPSTPLDPSTLVGVWDAARTIGDDLAGPITVTSTRAQLDGFEATALTEGTTRAYRFPGGRGELRVTQIGGKSVAFWTQPKTVSGTAYVTPVELRAVAPGVFRGQVYPLADRVVMSLYVNRDANGDVVAFLRDPLFNLGRRFKTMKITSDGSALKLLGPDPPLTAELAVPNTLDLALPDSGFTALEFVRRTESAPAPDAMYRRPLPTGDGWPIVSASGVGLRESALEDVTRFATQGPPTSVTSPAVHAIAIARHGKLVFDRYFGQFGEATLHDTRSAGKTYADVLAGAAIESGVHLSGDTPVLPLFARYGALANMDARKARITLGDTLSMATGLDCDDNDDHSVANEDAMQNQSAQPDWYRLVLDTRMVRDPGTKAVYCSASINLAGGAIAAASREWLPALFARYVAGPLEMQRYALNLTPTGDWYLGGGAYVRPRDFLKVGQLFLNGGTWNGHRILSQAWIKRSWDARLALGPGDGYGYAWHVRSYEVHGVTYPTYEAQGNGGQILDVIPRLDLAVMLA